MRNSSSRWDTADQCVIARKRWHVHVNGRCSDDIYPLKALGNFSCEKFRNRNIVDYVEEL